MNFSASRPCSPSRFWLAYARWVLSGLLLAGYWVSGWLRPDAGWENHWIENVQVAVLVGGLLFAAIAFRRAPPGSELRCLALFTLPIWALCAARELSWGATFLTAGTMGHDGPSFTSRDLWYRPGIAPLVVVALAFSVYVFLRYRLDRPLFDLVRRRQFPWFELALCVAAAVLAAAVEGHVGGLALPGVGAAKETMEEWWETLVYLGLATAQMRIFTTLSDGQAASTAVGRR
ncbi:hypothetical protein ACSFA0_02930 [Variovorax sp. LT1P1]|uniref:hypothetical protein n=1 Tax=Variovorax sp. LT1P1 TaxID=3443730 RepID=UPI003F47263B